jgi:hypothetical protein
MSNKIVPQSASEVKPRTKLEPVAEVVFDYHGLDATRAFSLFEGMEAPVISVRYDARWAKGEIMDIEEDGLGMDDVAEWMSLHGLERMQLVSLGTSPARSRYGSWLGRRRAIIARRI